MKIRELVKDLSCHFNTIHGEKICADTDIQGLLDTEITGIASDSRKVLPGSLFFCIVGANSDGHDYAAMAMASKGLGICISPQIQLNDMPFPLKYMEFEPTLKRTVGIGTRSLSGCTRAAREFISCARRWVRANV